MAVVPASFVDGTPDKIEGAKGSIQGFAEPQSLTAKTQAKRTPFSPRPTKLDRAARNREIKECVRAWFTRDQICRVSAAWDWSIKWPQQVSEILRQLKLVCKTPTDHVLETNDMLIDVILEGHAAGWVTVFWEKEHALGGFRSDFFIEMQKGKRVHCYYGEMQLSRMSVDEWVTKLRPYWTKFHERPHKQHVLIRCVEDYVGRRALEAMNKLLEDKTSTRLFLLSKDGQWLTRSGEVRGLVQ